MTNSKNCLIFGIVSNLFSGILIYWNSALFGVASTGVGFWLAGPLSTFTGEIVKVSWLVAMNKLSLEAYHSSICKSMKSWLDSDSSHVAVVHCKVLYPSVHLSV